MDWSVVLLVGSAGLAAFMLGMQLLVLGEPVRNSAWRRWLERLMRWSTRQQYAEMLRHANLKNWHATDLWGMRWLGAMLVGLLLAALTRSWLLSLLGMFMLWLGVGLWVKQRIRDYQSELTVQLPAFLDLLSLCLSAGMNLQTGVQLVLSYQEPGALVSLWQTWLLSVRSGQTRVVAFQQLLDSVQAPAIRRICVALIQAEQAGSGMAQCLSAHSKQLRQAQLMQAERQALQAPVKMLLPLVVCFFPSTFLVLGFSIFINLGDFLD